jgi:diphthamide biosynthesis protein 7
MSRQLIHTLRYPSAILDLHFLPSTSLPHIRFAVASSTGGISFFRVAKRNDDFSSNPKSGEGSEPSGSRIVHISTHLILPPEIIITSFAFLPQHMFTSPQAKADIVMAATTSSNGVYVISFQRDLSGVTDRPRNEGKTLSPYIQHSDQAWYCAWHGHGDCSRVSLYTGGDDSRLIMLRFAVKLDYFNKLADSKKSDKKKFKKKYKKFNYKRGQAL